MNFSIYELISLLALILVLVYWWRSREQHRIALANARRYCEKRGIQLLDDTLVFRKYSLSKTRGRRYFSRIYSFDFCLDGEDRHKGEIVLAGLNVLRVMLETDQLEITEY